MTRARNISRILSNQEISGNINLDGNIGSNGLVSDSVSSLRLFVSGVTTSTQGFSGNITGTAATFTGNVTVGGTLTYDDVTNIDSVGLITARDGLQVTGGIATVSGQTNLANVNVSGVSTFQDNVRLGNNDKIQFGDSQEFSIYYNSVQGENRFEPSGGSPTVIMGSTLNLESITGEVYLNANSNGAVNLYYDNSKKFETTSSGIIVTGNVNVSAASTFSGKINANSGVGFTGFLREGINIVSGKLSDNTTINIDHSMAHYFTTTETTTAIPNITSTAGINTDLSVGETFSVNVITTAAAAGYSTGARIDAGATLPVLWNGGTDPSAGGSEGVDVYTFQVIKTADATFTILGNVTNFA